MLTVVDSAVAESQTPLLGGAAEANHRIANHLAMIAAVMRMQGADLRSSAVPMSGDEVCVILESLGARLETVGRLHRLLARASGEAAIDLSTYLREIADGVVSSLSVVGETELHFASELGCFVAAEKALPFGLIACELITNAIKYAHPAGVPGQVRVACWRVGNEIAVEIADDGVGLPEGLDPLKSGRMGFRLVRSLAEQVGATIAFYSDELGLAYTLRMPIV